MVYRELRRNPCRLRNQSERESDGYDGILSSREEYDHRVREFELWEHGHCDRCCPPERADEPGCHSGSHLFRRIFDVVRIGWRRRDS